MSVMYKQKNENIILLDNQKSRAVQRREFSARIVIGLTIELNIHLSVSNGIHAHE